MRWLSFRSCNIRGLISLADSGAPGQTTGQTAGQIANNYIMPALALAFIYPLDGFREMVSQTGGRPRPQKLWKSTITLQSLSRLVHTQN